MPSVADNIFAVAVIVNENVRAFTAQKSVRFGFVFIANAAPQNGGAVFIAAGVEIVCDCIADQSDVHGVVGNLEIGVVGLSFVVDLSEIDGFYGVEEIIGAKIERDIARVIFENCSFGVKIRAVRKSEYCLVTADICRFTRRFWFDVDRSLLDIVAKPLRQEVTFGRRTDRFAV